MKKVILPSILLCIMQIQAADNPDAFAHNETLLSQGVQEDEAEEAVVNEKKPNQGGYIDAVFSYFTPKEAIKNVAGEAAGQAVKQALAKENLQDLKNVLNEGIDHLGDRFDESIERIVAQEGPCDRFLGQTKRELKQVTQDIFDEQLRPFKQEFVIEFAQNLAKTTLLGIKGCFGAVIAYNNLMTYLAEQQKNPDQETKLFGYAVRTSNLRLCAATAGAGTFASACLLTHYWFK